MKSKWFNRLQQDINLPSSLVLLIA